MKYFRHVKASLVGAFLLLAVRGFAAVNFSDTIAADGAKTVAQGAKPTDKNAKGLGFKCLGAATITMTNDGGVKDGTLWHLVEAKAGEVVVDISGCGFETFTFGGGLVAQSPGKVILKASSSLTNVVFGSTFSPERPYDVAAFEIQVDGARTTAVPIVFRDSFCLMRAPAADMTWSIAKQSKVTLGDAASGESSLPTGAGDLLAKYYDADGVLDIGPDGLDVAEFTILSPNALTAGKTLKVGGSASARFYICYYNDWWSQWGLKAGLGSTARANAAMRPKFDIVLDGPNAVLRTGDANGLFIDGDVTGSGTVKITNGGKDYSSVYFCGKYQVTGPLVSDVDNNGKSFAKVVFTNPEGYLGDENTPSARVGLASNQGVSYELTGAGPYAANLAQLASSYTRYGTLISSTNVFIAVSANTQLAVADLDGVVKVADGLEQITATNAVRLVTDRYTYLARSSAGSLATDGLQGQLLRIEGVSATSLRIDDTVSGVEIVATNGAEIVLCGNSNDVRVTCAQGSRVSVQDAQWVERLDRDGGISLWLDATRATTSTNLYAQKDYDGFKVGDVVTYTIPGRTEPVTSVDNWSDWRPGRTGKFTNTIYNNTSESFWLPSYANFYPHLMDDGPGGKPYMSLYANNKNCRFHGYNWPNGKQPKFAVMVFGSQYGGGSCVLAVNKEKFGRDRSSYENPIVTNAAYKTGYFWVDGEAVDPTETGFSGGWQVVACKIPDNVRGLGYSANYTGTAADAGNQNYGEILFFNSELNDEDRQCVERYLVGKWGLQATYKGPTYSSRIAAYGDGTIGIGMDTELSGGFTGTFEVREGANLVTHPQREVPGEEAAVTNNRTVWFDADYPNALVMSKTTGHSLNVARWYDRTGVLGAGSFADGTFYANNYNSDTRSPSVRTLNGRTWLDFSNIYGFEQKSSGSEVNDLVYGNMLRFGVAPNNPVKDPEKVETKTIFVMMDSSKGGGTPFLGGIGASSDLGVRYGKTEVNSKSVAELTARPIWAGVSKTSTFAGGSTYLNGTAVDGTQAGFSGGPELLTAVTDGSKSFLLGCFGYYSATDGTTATDIGEILGEVIAYDTVLGEQQRTDIEAYLMWKWLKVVRSGYDPVGGLSGACVSGAGTVVIDSLSRNVPAVADGFTGTVDCQRGDLTFDLTGGTVANPLRASAGAARFPAAMTLNISATGDLTAGTYTLIEAARIVPGTTFTVAGGYDPERFRVTLETTATSVKAVVTNRGGMIIMFW